jgi:hypothetical protein
MVNEKNDNNTCKRIAGADDIYPLIVYGLLKCNVPKLKSNLAYIKYFRHELRLESSDDYFFTTVNTALQFIDEELSHKKLNIKENDFIKFCAEEAEREIERMKVPKIPFKSI